MIRDHHQIPNRKPGRDSPRRVRHEQLAHSHRVKDAHGKSGKRSRVSFVHVKSPAQRNDFSASETADDCRAFMSDYRGLREAGYVAERDTHGVLDRAGEPTES
jgi:hypothetical protein